MAEWQLEDAKSRFGEAKHGNFVDLLPRFPKIPDEIAAELEGSRPVEPVREIEF
jgi:hypothetical protein